MKRYIKAASGNPYEIWVASMTSMNGVDEWEVISTYIDVDQTGITSYDINELKQYLSKHQMSEEIDKGNKVISKVAFIVAYDAQIDDFNCVAYQTYDGQMIDE